ncbi:hypothetical protein ACHQM5_010679 [Ranunculus cassubicifolius]
MTNQVLYHRGRGKNFGLNGQFVGVDRRCITIQDQTSPFEPRRFDISFFRALMSHGSIMDAKDFVWVFILDFLYIHSNFPLDFAPQVQIQFSFQIYVLECCCYLHILWVLKFKSSELQLEL